MLIDKYHENFIKLIMIQLHRQPLMVMIESIVLLTKKEKKKITLHKLYRIQVRQYLMRDGQNCSLALILKMENNIYQCPSCYTKLKL